MVLSDLPYYLIPVFAGLLAVLAVWFAWLQVRQLFWLRDQPHLTHDDRQHFKWQIIRRLAGCFLMLAAAVMLAGLMGMRILDRLDELILRSNQARIEEKPLAPLTEEERSFVLFSFAYVGVLMGAIVLLIGLGLWEIRSIRKHGIRHRRRIREDERTMLERQLPLLYQERQRSTGLADDADEPPGRSD